MKYERTYDKIEEETYDVDEFANIDIKINPDYYIHHGIRKAQNCLVAPDSKVGFLQFQMLIQNVEHIAAAAGLIDVEYKVKIKDFKKGKDQEGKDVEDSSEYHTATDPLVKGVHLASYKLKCILEGIFDTKPISDSLKLESDIKKKDNAERKLRREKIKAEREAEETSGVTTVEVLDKVLDEVKKEDTAVGYKSAYEEAFKQPEGIKETQDKV